MDTVDRIFELLDKAGMEQKQFAELICVSDDTASNWKRHKSASYTKYLPQIAAVLGTTVGYLLTGERDSAAGVQVGHLSPEDLALLRKYHALPSDLVRGKVLGYIDSLLV